MSVDVMTQGAGSKVRRFSAVDLKPNDINKSHRPSVVLPQGFVDGSFAETFAAARSHIDKEDQGVIEDDEVHPDSKPSTGNIASEYCFAFDIDGVLLKGGHVIPEAKEALKVLNGKNNDNLHIPYIFLTNGGGKTEEERCIDLSQQLEVPISSAQFICGHSPLSTMASKYKTVLVVGGVGDKCRHVAETYGFKDVVTPGDIIRWKPSCVPFRTLTEEELATTKERNFTDVKFDAIFVFADSRDWGSDAQIILDLLLSKDGQMGTQSETSQEGPPIYFAHDDFVWSTDYDLSRLGMGALRVMVEALYTKKTGKPIDITSYGKPQKGTFEYATRVLKEWRRSLGYGEKPPKTIYFVGDTPESDIRGTNEYDDISSMEWHSILVQTGVYQANTVPNYKPKQTVKTVLDAVHYGMDREREKKANPGCICASKKLKSLQLSVLVVLSLVIFLICVIR